MSLATTITPEELEALITAIHATPHRLVLEFAGAGAQALAWLHGVGGSSRTILEATDRYAPASLISAIGFRAERFTSLRVAVAMADKAWGRARTLAGPGLPVIGIGSTATIATDRAKRGDHRCCAAVKDAFGIVTYALTISKGLRTRQQEEVVVSLLIVRALAEGCGVAALPELPLAA
ncbi:MAG: hypothetical protein M3511_03710, partial [Deinococcota bacterium]|nr:hypothetical protein [Deinococcota bacterium]